MGRAFAEVGIDVETWRIHRSIGMDGSTFVRSLSDDAPDETQKRLKRLALSVLAETASSLRPLPGARMLLQRVADLGFKVVLADSAPEDELVSQAELENAGAVMVFENAEDPVKHVEETPIARLACIGSS